MKDNAILKLVEAVKLKKIDGFERNSRVKYRTQSYFRCGDMKIKSS